MRLVPLTQNQVAMVDDEDFDRVIALKWYAYKSGSYDKSFYCGRMVRGSDGKRRRISMQKFIMGVDSVLDHVDGNGLNNQKSNLRPANRTQNGRNRRVQKHSSPYKGVTWFGPSKAYMAKICIDGIEKFLGYFKDPAAGARAYDEAAIKHFGEFARTNQQMGVLSAL